MLSFNFRAAALRDQRTNAVAANKFSIEIFGLITAGLLEVHSEITTECGQTIETACVRITAADRRALED
jgi:hypothetical protein